MNKLLRLLPWTVTAVALLLLAVAAPAQTRRAVVIGIDQYSLPDAASGSPAAAPQGEAVTTHAARRDFRGSWIDLEGSVNDAIAMAQLLQSRYEFQPENIHYLLGPMPGSKLKLPPHQAPTRDNILKAIETYLIQEAKPGDILVFYYAGHGSQVYNSLSNKLDKLDESIVPADANKGAPDIRDKEIARIFNRVLGGLHSEPDKRVTFTAIFDSCHSGSISRGFQVHPGKLRYMLPDNRDVKDPPSGDEPPEHRGALIFSSALDSQPASEATDEDGTAHGAFTICLLRALRGLPTNAPAKDVFFTARNFLKSLPQGQDPVIAGNAERQAQTLFGGASAGMTGQMTVIATGMDEDGNVSVEGGYALGLAPKCEFAPAGAKQRGSEAQPRLQILSVDSLTQSTAKVVGGKASDIKFPQTFVLDRWVASSGNRMKVWIPPSQLSDAQVRAAVAEFLKLGTRVQWVDDPTADSPTHILAWSGTEWTLSTNGVAQGLGPDAGAQQVLAKLGPADKNKPVKLFLSLPPTAELAAALGKALADRKAVDLAAKPQDAAYILMGHISSDQAHALEYAWVLPNTVLEEKSVAPGPDQGKEADQGSPTPPVLPPRTQWEPASSNADALAPTVTKLNDYILLLERLQAWLQLPAPPDQGSFPYRLALRYTGRAEGKVCPRDQAPTDKTAGDGATVEGGDCYQMFLQLTDPARATGVIERRWVYIFTIDSFGRTQLLFPNPANGNTENENHMPVPVAGQEDKNQLEFAVGPRLRITTPFGVDSYIILTTEDMIPDLSVFQSVGVRTRAFDRGPANPLDALLRNVTGNSRGTASTPTNWSVQRISLKSEKRSEESK